MDREYWERYYANGKCELIPSLFARHVREHVIGKDHRNIGQFGLIELGCGNGRDALYFASEGLKVYAVDQCREVIESLAHRTSDIENITFQCADFSRLEDAAYGIVYSRFTLHSISVYQQKQVLTWAFRNLIPDGYLCIEARGQKNELYGKGKPVEGEKDAYIWDNHYRRFLHFEELRQNLVDLGFIILESAEKQGFSPHKGGGNETYIRVIAHKKTNQQ
jgi:tellurite methyltransferase